MLGLCKRWLHWIAGCVSVSAMIETKTVIFDLARMSLWYGRVELDELFREGVWRT